MAASRSCFPAVDGDDAGAALGQQADGRGSDDAGRAGHDGDPAIEANSIGHFWGFLWLAPVIPDFDGFRARVGALARTGATISSETGLTRSGLTEAVPGPGQIACGGRGQAALSPPYSAC